MFKFFASLFATLQCLFYFNMSANAQKPASEYEIVAKDGAWCWFSDPRVVYHQGQYERIYFGYINSLGDVVISTKDLRTNKIEKFTLHEKLQVDDHNVPSILILPDGRLIAFYTEHNGRFFMRKSKGPEDISSWEEERVIPFGGKRITYSHPILLMGEKNRIYMFWRGSDWRPSFSFSDDLGDTWSKTSALIESTRAANRPYLKVTSNNVDRIDFVFSDGHPSVETENSVYHMFYKDGIFNQTNGAAIASINQLPIKAEVVHKVYDGNVTKVRSWISDIAINKSGRPVIVYTRYPTETDHRYHYAYWDGKRWMDEEICKAGGWMPVVKEGEKVREPHYSGGVSLDPVDPSNVYLSREINSVFEIEHWKKGRISWVCNRITSDSEFDNLRPVVAAKNSKFVLWMTGTYYHYSNFETDLRINTN